MISKEKIGASRIDHPWGALYANPKYRKQRALFLRDHPLCSMCPKATPSTTLDHKIPHKGNLKLFWDQKNWQALCDHCHNAHKQAMERNAYTVKGNDGWPID